MRVGAYGEARAETLRPLEERAVGHAVRLVHLDRHVRRDAEADEPLLPLRRVQDLRIAERGERRHRGVSEDVDADPLDAVSHDVERALAHAHDERRVREPSRLVVRRSLTLEEGARVVVMDPLAVDLELVERADHVVERRTRRRTQRRRDPTIEDVSALFDHHIHSDRSDGTVTLAGRAKTVAVRPHGVSDHFPWRNKLKSDDDVLGYIDDASRLGLRVGLEYDLGVAPELRSTTRDGLHYMIGALHQLEVDGEWIHYDDAGAFLKGQRTTYDEAARFADPSLIVRMRERTLDVVRDGIERVGIDILGHATMSPLAALGDPEVLYPPEWQERLIGLCVAADVAIEVNETYGVPHRAFLERAQRLGARFSVGSDTHFSLKPLDKTMAMIAAAGLAEDSFLAGHRVRARASGPTASGPS